MGPCPQSVLPDLTSLLSVSHTYPLLVRVKLAVREHTRAQIFLCSNTEIFVFIQDLSVKRINIGKLLIRCISVSIYFVFDLAGRRANRDHALNVEEFIPAIVLIDHRPLPFRVQTYVTVTDVVG